MVYRLPLLIVLLCFGAALPGCTVCQLARLVSIEEPKIFDTKADRKISLVTYRALADEAWATTGACCPDDCTSADYSWGFREGFAEYVYAGGSGEAPALPPRSYWQSDMRTPEGAMAVRSWFQGYRHGAQVAREGGYRRTATVAASASVRDCDACGKPNGCGKDGCDTCFSPEGGSCVSSSPYEISGPTLQQPELQRLEKSGQPEGNGQFEGIVPETVIPLPETASEPASESLPIPQIAPPLPSIDPSSDTPDVTIPDDQVPDEEDEDFPFLFGDSPWKASSVSPSVQRRPLNPLGNSTKSITKPVTPVSGNGVQFRKIPSQKHPVSQAFFPIVR